MGQTQALARQTGRDRKMNEDQQPDFGALVRKLRSVFASGKTHSLEWRDAQLAAIGRLLEDCEQDIHMALFEDLGKPQLEAWVAETSFVADEVAYARKHLRRWMAPRPVSTPLFALPGKTWVQPEPLGVVLIMGAWNYPFQLIFAPLVGAIAAGNCALLKPSEIAPATSALVARLLPQYLDADCFAVVEGAVEETTALLRERFDHILYTGGAEVGRIVMTAAAKHLTPVTLELGGKSPCVVLPDADLEVTARRLAWGKFMNAGQTCIAPDYVLTDEATEAKLVPLLEANIKQMFGADPAGSRSFARIVNQRHLQRLGDLLAGGHVLIGGKLDADDKYMAPTVLTGVQADSEVMREEIFGPILPIMRSENLDAAIAHIRANEKPLAAYLFSKSKAAQQQFLGEVSSGSACINDVMMFTTAPELPFGGVGASGMGAYKGEHGFRTFSHMKAVMKRSWWPDLALRYAPYTAAKFKWLKRLK
jgi:aldehyde dehydrogenase (NAD+)